jgi:hypothetical protein
MKNLFRLVAVVFFFLAVVAFAATPKTSATYHEGTMPHPHCIPDFPCAVNQ